MNDFGDLKTINYNSNAGCGNNIRGLSGGGNPLTNVIEFVNIATTGDGSNFGNLVRPRTYIASGIASPTRGMWHEEVILQPPRN